MPRVLNMRDVPAGMPDSAIYCGGAMRQWHLSGSPFAHPFKLRRKNERAECGAMYNAGSVRSRAG
jgi:hypothetical protein